MDEKRPNTRMGDIPVWHHHHSSKMRLVHTGIMSDMLVLRGSAAELIIERSRTNWLVRWSVIHSPTRQVNGQAVFSSDDLFRAFGMSPFMEERHSEWLIHEFGGTVASQGKFIRYKVYLNIPCPGTGHDGDPNISIMLDDEITKAVRDLVNNCRS